MQTLKKYIQNKGEEIYFVKYWFKHALYVCVNHAVKTFVISLTWTYLTEGNFRRAVL